MNQKSQPTGMASSDIQSGEQVNENVSKRILITGSGFGGTYALWKLMPLLRRNENIKVTMVSNENFFMFTPLLHMVAMGIIETRHVSYPVRKLQNGRRFEFIQAEVNNIDLAAKQIKTSAGPLKYDYLLLSLGSVTKMPDFEYSTAEGSNLFTLKSLLDAVYIRNHIINIFERASFEKDPVKQGQMLTFVVAGAGYTGIQLVTELRDFIFRSLTRVYKKIDPRKIRIIVVEIEDKIMSDSRPKLINYITSCLNEMGIEIKLNSRITALKENQVVINDSEHIGTETVLWIAGVVSNPRIAGVKAAIDDMGRILVDEYLRVPGFEGVYAIGDCANFKDVETGIPIPPRAHTTVRQAKIAASNILAEIRGTGKKPYHFSNPFDTVSLGTVKAAFRYNDFYLFGKLAKFVWLAGYLLLMKGSYNRTRIFEDGFLSAIFGRDITNVKIKP
jgi:NADH dehydrogenase